jgi:nitric oxide dioxygenase
VFSEREIELVRRSWAAAARDPDAAAGLFYGRLFETAPAVKPLFTSDMKEQGRKLMQMIGVAVNNMHRIEEIAPALQALGARHEEYGASPEHYPVVGGVLLDTLEAALGDGFDAETRDAWRKTYDAVASAMTSGG